PPPGSTHFPYTTLFRSVIQDGRVQDPFMRKYAWFVRQSLDAEAMSRAARCLVGRHDFRCFETEWPNRLTSVRTVTHLSVNRFGRSEEHTSELQSPDHLV